MDWEDDAFRSAQGRIILDLGLLAAAALLLYGLFVAGGGIGQGEDHGAIVSQV